MRTLTVCTAAFTLGLTLACGGMMPGAPVQTVSVTPGQSFSTTWTDPATRELWLIFDLSHTQPYQVTGNLDITVDGNTTSHAIDFTSQGAPIVGNNGRITFGGTSTNINGKGNAAGQVKLTTFEEGASSFALSGTLTPSAGTTVNALSIVATD